MPHSSVVSIIVNKDLATGQEHCLATGYNHTPDGSCCEVNGKTKDSVIHAEVAAITSLNKKLVANLQVVNPTVIDNKNLTMFVTHTPCIDCSIAIKKAGIETIIVVERFLKFDKCVEVHSHHLQFFHFYKLLNVSLKLQYTD